MRLKMDDENERIDCFLAAYYCALKHSKRGIRRTSICQKSTGNIFLQQSVQRQRLYQPLQPLRLPRPDISMGPQPFLIQRSALTHHLRMALKLVLQRQIYQRITLCKPRRRVISGMMEQYLMGAGRAVAMLPNQPECLWIFQGV